MSYVGFQKLKRDLATKGDVRDPAAVAAAVGRSKYGPRKFQRAAAQGKKLRGAKPQPKSRRRQLYARYVKQHGR